MRLPLLIPGCPAEALVKGEWEPVRFEGQNRDGRLLFRRTLPARQPFVAVYPAEIDKHIRAPES